MIDIKNYKNEVKEIVEACHRLAELGYVASSGGNISLRVEENLMLITPTKTSKRKMRKEDICMVDLSGKTIYANEGKKPTGETPFHTMIMRKRPDVKCVVHAHPPVLTGFAIANSDLMEKAILPEPVIEVGPAIRVKYATPISDELSDEFAKEVDKSNFFLMENHGATICNINSVFECVEQLQMMECMAISICVAKLLDNFKPLEVEDLRKLDGVIKQRKLKMPGALGKYSSTTQLYGFE